MDEIGVVVAVANFELFEMLVTITLSVTATLDYMEEAKNPKGAVLRGTLLTEDDPCRFLRLPRPGGRLAETGSRGIPPSVNTSIPTVHPSARSTVGFACSSELGRDFGDFERKFAV
jgi:hypothetical protein